MPIKERPITLPVKNALQFIEEILADPNCPNRLVVNKAALAEEFGLSPQELTVLVAALGLTFHHQAKQQEGQGLSKPDKRRLI